MTVKFLVALILSAFVTPAPAQLSNGGVLPTDAEIHGLQTLCAGGNVKVTEVNGRLNAEIMAWRKSAAGAAVSFAKKDLGAVIDKVKSDAGLAEVTKSYVDCVSNNLQRFLDREERRPRPVSKTGQSETLVRADYASDLDIRKVGCGEAESYAMQQLKSECGDRYVAVTGNPRCSGTTGGLRTFVATVDGECRVR